MANDRESIQTRLLSNINDKYDKSAGSFFYDAEKPVSIELESAYVTLEGMLDKYFADTATGKDLERIVKTVGLTRKITTKSYGIVTITGLKDAIIKKGEKVSSDSINFIFTEDAVMPESKTIDISVECEKYGIVGNVPVGAIKFFPKTLEGLQTATNKEAFNNGYDEETEENLRERYYTKIRTPATSGNIFHYLNWAKEVIGVGDARVIPLWAGNGSVKVVIINSNKIGADTTLINSVANHIEENRPIGATVTVVSATEVPINIKATLVIDTINVTGVEVRTNIEYEIKDYLKSIAFKENYISYAKIGSIILGTTGVKDYSNLKLNDGTININITDTQVAVFGVIVIG